MLTTATCKTGTFLYSSLKWQILILYFVLLVMDVTIRKHLSPKYLTWISLAMKKAHLFLCYIWEIQRTSAHFAIHTHSEINWYPYFTLSCFSVYNMDKIFETSLKGCIFYSYYQPCYFSVHISLKCSVQKSSQFSRWYHIHMLQSRIILQCKYTV